MLLNVINGKTAGNVRMIVKIKNFRQGLKEFK